MHRCRDHARRKFIKAGVTAQKSRSRKANFIKNLDSIVIKTKELSPEEKYNYRQEHPKPLLDEFYTFLLNRYCLKQNSEQPQTIAQPRGRYSVL